MNALQLAPACKSSLTIFECPPWQATNNGVPPSTDEQSTIAPALSNIFVISKNPP